MAEATGGSVSAPGARLAVTVGPGQSQTVAVGARSAQPVAVKGYENAYLRLSSYLPLRFGWCNGYYLDLS